MKNPYVRKTMVPKGKIHEDVNIFGPNFQCMLFSSFPSKKTSFGKNLKIFIFTLTLVSMGGKIFFDKFWKIFSDS